MSLGRGLESLIPKKSDQAPEGGSEPVERRAATPEARGQSSAPKKENIFYIELEKIKPNPEQPRQEFEQEDLSSLANSIRNHGILQPLIVTKHEIDLEHGRKVEYHIVAGERRWRAAKLAGFSQVPVIIREADNQSKLELALIENIQRTDLNPIEEARAYQKLSEDFSLTQEEIAQRVAKSREAVANKIRLLSLPHEVKKLLSQGTISEGHAKVLLALKNPEKQIFLANKTISNNWSVRALAEKIKTEIQPQKKKEVEHHVDPELEAYAKGIQEVLGTQVSILGNRQKGKLAINFFSQEELEEIVRKILE